MTTPAEQRKALDLMVRTGDIGEMLDLLEKIRSAKTNGDALGALAGYRFATRMDAILSALDVIAEPTEEMVLETASCRSDEMCPFLWNVFNDDGTALCQDCVDACKGDFRAMIAQCKKDLEDKG